MGCSLKENWPSEPVATIAVTGGTGFIGRALIGCLLDGGLRVRALVRPASLHSRFEAPGLSWVCGELSSLEALERLVDGASAVVHCAGAVRGVSPVDFAAANVVGVERLVQAARSSKECRRFLLISSLAAGAPDLSPYAASKRQGEEILRSAGGSLHWTILRPPAVYGPGDRELLPMLRWMRRGMIFVPGGGSGRFSLVFITDLTRAIQVWIRSGEGNAASFEIHDGKPGGYCWEEVRTIAANLYRRPVRRIDIPRTVLHAAALLNAAAARVTGYRPMLTPGKVRELCHTDWTCSNGRFSNAFGWGPEVDLREGLLRTLG